MKYLSIALALFILIGCQTENKNPDKRLKEKEVPAEFELGEAKDGTYSNNFFDFSFRYHEDMDLMSFEELEAMMQAEANNKKSGKERKTYEASLVRTASLFAGFRYDIDSIDISNPNVIVMSENLKGNKMIQYGDDYLEIIRDNLPSTGIDAEQIGTIKEKALGNKKFYQLRFGIKSPFLQDEFAGYQEYYCTIMNDFALVFIFTYGDEKESDYLNLIRKSMIFKKS